MKLCLPATERHDRLYIHKYILTNTAKIKTNDLTSNEVKKIYFKFQEYTNSTGHDQINKKSLKKLPNKAVVALTMFNSSIRLLFSYVWIVSVIIQLARSGKDASLVQNTTS